MMALVAGHYLKEERGLPLEVFGYSVNLFPVFGGEGQVITPLKQGGEGVAEFQNLFKAVRNLVVER